MKLNKGSIKKIFPLIISIVLMLSFYNVYLDIDKKIETSIFEIGNEELILSSSNTIEQPFRTKIDKIESINLFPAENKKYDNYSFNYQIIKDDDILVDSDINLEEVSKEAPINIVLPRELKNVENEDLKIVISTNSNDTLALKSDDTKRLSISAISNITPITNSIFNNLFILLICFVCITFILLFFSKISYKLVFVCTLIVSGLMMNFLIPVGNVPDEANAHIITVYHYSNKLIGLSDNPSNVKIRKSDEKIFHYSYIDSEKMITYLNDIKINSSDKKLIESHRGVLNTKGYTFTYYLSTVGFTLGRILNLNGILCVLLGRFFNYLFFVLCSYFAISRIKSFKRLVVMFSFLPMTIQQACSISYDSMVISLGIVIFTLSVNLFHDRKLSKREAAVLIASCVLLIPCKSFAYAPLLLVPISFYFNKIFDNKYIKKINPRILYFIVCLILVTLFLLIYILRENIPASSMLYPLLHPQLFIKLMTHTMYSELNHMFVSFIGSPLGLLHINIYAPLLFVYTILITIVILSSKNVFANRIKFIWILAFLCSLMGILLAMYSWSYSLGFTNLSTEFAIKGFQGRYMLPLALPFGAALANSKSGEFISLKGLIYINVLLIYFVFGSIMIFLI